MRKTYERYFLVVEWVAPLLAGLGFALYETFTDAVLSTALGGTRATLFTAIASISGGLLGFVITGIAILIALPHGPRWTQLLQIPAGKLVFKVFSSTARWLTLTLGISVLGLLTVDPTDSSPWSIWIFWAASSVTVVVALRIWRCIWVLDNVVNIVLQDFQSRAR